MGFKCPMCLKDFGNSKAEWKEHIMSAHHGIGLDVVKVVEKSTTTIQITDESEDPNETIS